MREDRPLLRLLDIVAWRGQAVAGERPQRLLAALAQAEGRPVPASELIWAVWGSDEPANPHKAVQVVVSRVRAQTGAEVVLRSGSGYRLGLGEGEVDTWARTATLTLARQAETTGDVITARRSAEELLAAPAPADDGAGALGELRRVAADQRAQAAALLGRVASRSGDHHTALAVLGTVDLALDEPTLVALLRSEAAVRGTPAALHRFERERTGLRERLGVDPGPQLQALHAELLSADRPVRTGLRFDATSLVGREGDLAVLRAVMSSSRITTIVGPGGLGKTRLAHVLARDATLPVVHFVELVAAASADDVVAELGSALGVRSSVGARRTLTAEQRTDTRTRIAHHLARAPTLLVLDNCEHVVESVAPLVATLVASVRDLRVLITSRAPLAITGERVHALRQLAVTDGVELFCQRADAARPGCALPPDEVRRVVGRLDGLPLAIELAAAKVRMLSVPQISALLDDRFALLTGGDRSAPARHRTLEAVIDWSWNLLGTPEREALGVLAVLADGFSLDTADALLSGAATHPPGRPRTHDVVRGLVDQSLLGVDEAAGSVRFRMLETVREFGLRKLDESGRREAARTALRQWAQWQADDLAARLFSPDQFQAMDRLALEEGNLVDVLRGALADPDPDTVVRVLTAVGSFWVIRGEHSRLAGLSEQVDRALQGWRPTAELTDTTLAATSLVLVNSLIERDGDLDSCASCRLLLEEYGDQARAPVVRGLVHVLGVLSSTGSDPVEVERRQLAALIELAESADPAVAGLALEWACYLTENSGDADSAVHLAHRALALADDAQGPWSRASRQVLLAFLLAQLGRHAEAAVAAQAGLPVLDRLGAHDDAITMRAAIAVAALAEGRLDDAEQVLADAAAQSGPGDRAASFGIVLGMAEAELVLMRGQREHGLELLRDLVRGVRERHSVSSTGETGLEPWVVFPLSLAVTAHAVYAGDDPGLPAEGGVELVSELAATARRVLTGTGGRLDFPVAGMTLFALGAWALSAGATALPVTPGRRGDLATHLLVLAEGFGYSRFLPVMAWERTAPRAEELAPGRIVAWRRQYAGRRGPDLLEEARVAVEALWDALVEVRSHVPAEAAH